MGYGKGRAWYQSCLVVRNGLECTHPVSAIDMYHFVVTLELKQRGRGITEEATSFITFFNSEVGKMEFTSNAERQGFAPSTHICPYHVWKPTSVVRSCTCSPTPAQQVKWEKKLFDSGKGVAILQAIIQPDCTLGRAFLNRIDRRSMAVFCRTSGETLASALRTARKGIAGRFLSVCEVVRSR
jgi:hypothetical protein